MPSKDTKQTERVWSQLTTQQEPVQPMKQAILGPEPAASSQGGNSNHNS